MIDPFLRVDSAVPTHSSVDQNTAIAWVLYAAVAIVLLLVSSCIVIYFQPKNSAASVILRSEYASTSAAYSGAPLQVTSRFINIVCILSIYVSLLCLFTAPVDVYLLENALPHVHANNALVLRILYQVYFGVLVIYTFIGAPLVYNYARQTEIAHLTMLFSPQQRLKVACKRTLCFLIGLSLLVMITMVILLCGKPTTSQIDWLKPLLHFSSDLLMSFRLLVGILLLSGMYLWISVCSRGLMSVPLVGLLMEDYSENETQTTFAELLRENAMEAQATEQTKETIRRRYMVEQQMSTVDQERLEQLKIREQMLTDRRAVLQMNIQRFTLTGQWRWLKVPLGMILLVISLLIFISMLITNLDKMVHSSFGKGFVLNAPVFPNPMDGILIITSQWFPVDYIVFSILFVYCFIVSFVILVRHGVRFLCFRLDRVQPRLTSASTMTIVALIMMYIAVVGLFSMLTLAPQYATFGHQTYVNETTGKVLPCTLSEAARAVNSTTLTHHCRMTQLASFYNSMAISFPMFGLAFFLGQFLFIFALLPWFIHSYCMAKSLPENAAVDEKRERLLNTY